MSRKAPQCGLVATYLATLIICLFLSQIAYTANNSPNQQDQSNQPLSSRLAFLRAQRAAAASRQAQQQQQQQQQQAAKNETKVTETTQSNKTTVSSAPNVIAKSITEVKLTETLKPPANTRAPSSEQAVSGRDESSPKKFSATNLNERQAQSVAASSSNNRSTRTADIFQNGDGFNLFVTNTCERELMHVNIKTSRPFFGVIHTRQQRQKSVCTVEGNGDTEYNLDISHVLNQQDPNYCGVIRARKESPEDKDLLSVVLAVRVHRNIELSDDKFFLLNCTNRCRKPDCSLPTSARLTEEETASNGRGELEGGEREGSPGNNAKKTAEEDECTVWKFPWLITLLWCMAILLLAMIISHCIMCSSLVCRCVKTEVEEREPSVYEGASDLGDEDSLYNKKTHPMRIDYDNKDIYKTSNNYEPYTLDDERSGDDRSPRQRENNRRRNRR